MMGFERDYDTELDDIVDDRYNPELMYAEQQTAKRVTEVFALLRNVVVLHVLEEQTLQEVADTLEIRRSTVERSWRLAQVVLREFL